MNELKNGRMLSKGISAIHFYSHKDPQIVNNDGFSE